VQQIILSKEANASEVAITQEPPRFPSTARALRFYVEVRCVDL